MPRAHRVQRSFFDEAAPTRGLQPELRTQLASLLQALLMEAAGVPERRIEPHLQIEEGSDDEDHV